MRYIGGAGSILGVKLQVGGVGGEAELEGLKADSGGGRAAGGRAAGGRWVAGGAGGGRRLVGHCKSP